ncbi:hypothetical protein GPECTOR_97g761 [Gonium pectorale]|uniref:Uncharacterized protein n=1 Tax=Gonium pectorale TaxID=33097 RepID=A0A150G019_GONPE|nr:hypothetical protein GPECTOR_97g761 [Gonium pectorale]|eukprot:KXZ43223.1 hypothetical protein GPECTOR_97g761 [Gonium pectorale]
MEPKSKFAIPFETSELYISLGVRGLATCTALLCDVPGRPADALPRGQGRAPVADGKPAAENRPATPAPGGAPGSEASPAADPIYNLPNAVSLARLVSGPVIGVWLLQGHYQTATIALAISGASDWLDGYLARRYAASSVFGSYLDPLADKVLIGCVAGALLANGAMPVWLATVVVGRDVLLVSGAFVFRLRGFGWRWPGREAFFRTADVPALPAGGEQGLSGPGTGTTDGYGGPSGGVSFMRPLLISKANTVLQLVLLGGYLTRGMYGWPDGEPVAALEMATAATTVASLAAYASMATQGRLFK